MTVEEAFIAEITANPDDDTPRLIFADWLEEHGQEERGEFIHLQIAIANVGKGAASLRVKSSKEWEWQADREVEMEVKLKKREQELLSRVSKWEPDDGIKWDVRSKAERRRGFIEILTCYWEDWSKNAEQVLKHYPIREVTFIQAPPVESMTPHDEVWLKGRIRRIPITHAECIKETWQQMRPRKIWELLKSEWPNIKFHWLEVNAINPHEVPDYYGV